MQLSTNEKKILEHILRKNGVAQVVAMLPNDQIATTQKREEPKSGEGVELGFTVQDWYEDDGRPTESADNEIGFTVNSWHEDPEDTDGDSDLGFEVEDWHQGS